MKRLFSFLTIFLALSLTTVAQVFAETITNFDATYKINRDGTVNVTENITYDAQGIAHHGITRQVKLTRTNDQNQTFNITASDVSSNSPIQNNSSQDELNLRIGDANSTFTEVKTFTINYTLSGALTYFSDHDELYWNVTGNEWAFPIEKTTTTILLANETTVSNLNAKCYTGASGSTSQKCDIVKVPNGAVITTSTLNTGEGVTTVLGFPSSLVAKIEPVAQQAPSPLFAILAALGFLAFYFLLPFGVVVWWFLFGRDPKVPTGPTAWFDPPKHSNGQAMLPAEVGLLTDENVDARDITATIVSLAIRGFLKIKKEDGDNYTFTKSEPKKSGDSLIGFETTLYSGLFKTSNTATTKSLKTSFPRSVEMAKQELYKKLTAEKYFAHNPDTTRKIFASLGAVSLFMFNVLLGITLIVFSKFMPRKTLLGAQKKEEALSLKRFLSSQERQLNFQEQNWYFFEKLLPYAVAFGVTKVWAERFKDLAVPTEVDWYQGNELFSAYLFASSLDAFSHSAASLSATPYSSTRSSRGFSSGFSGGFSGGGGGGGGGGSW